MPFGNPESRIEMHRLLTIGREGLREPSCTRNLRASRLHATGQVAGVSHLLALVRLAKVIGEAARNLEKA